MNEGSGTRQAVITEDIDHFDGHGVAPRPVGDVGALSTLSGPENLDFVGFKEAVMRDEGQSLGLRLGDQHAIERIPVVRRKAGGAFGVGERDEQPFKTAGENTRLHRVGEVEAPQGGFDPSLPG